MSDIGHKGHVLIIEDDDQPAPAAAVAGSSACRKPALNNYEFS
jgi:hypothetical protein